MNPFWKGSKGELLPIRARVDLCHASPPATCLIWVDSVGLENARPCHPGSQPWLQTRPTPRRPAGTGAAGQDLAAASGPSAKVPFTASRWPRTDSFDLFCLHSSQPGPLRCHTGGRGGAGGTQAAAPAPAPMAVRGRRPVAAGGTAGRGQTLCRETPPPLVHPGSRASSRSLPGGAAEILKAYGQSVPPGDNRDRAEVMSLGVGASPIPVAGRWVMGRSS